jgi:uncharacterized protein YjbI with pentapeptide repeats
MKIFYMVGVLVMISSFGCSAVTGPEPPQILSPFPYPCTGLYKNQILSEQDIVKVQRAHEQWLNNSKVPDGQKADFCGAMLSRVKLQKTELKSAGFQMAMLADADFTGAILTEAQFQGANLSGAHFSKTDLRGAALDHAMLHLAQFRDSLLHYASLHHAMLYQTQLQGVDLTEVKGLSQSQINMACLDDDTKLPKELYRPPPCQQKHFKKPHRPAQQKQ